MPKLKIAVKLFTQQLSANNLSWLPIFLLHEYERTMTFALYPTLTQGQTGLYTAYVTFDTGIRV